MAYLRWRRTDRVWLLLLAALVVVGFWRAVRTETVELFSVDFFSVLACSVLDSAFGARAVVGRAAERVSAFFSSFSVLQVGKFH